MTPRLKAVGAGLLLLAAPAEAKKQLPPGVRIDLNRATVAELMRLPGIGRRRAEAIAARRARQPFRSPAEITEVEGIGKRWFERNQGRISAGLPAGLTGAPAAPRPAAPAAPRPAPPGAARPAKPGPARPATPGPATPAKPGSATPGGGACVRGEASSP